MEFFLVSRTLTNEFLQNGFGYVIPLLPLRNQFFYKRGTSFKILTLNPDGLSCSFYVRFSPKSTSLNLLKAYFIIYWKIEEHDVGERIVLSHL